VPVVHQAVARLPQVGWANASLRHLQQLPAMPKAPGTGVFREDSITAGMVSDVRAQLDSAALQRLRDGQPYVSDAWSPPHIAQSHGSTVQWPCPHTSEHLRR
jgi:hypothetical protein